jgi:hypothetical protein
MNTEAIIASLAERFTHLTFLTDETFYWSPKDLSIHYNQHDATKEASWALLHEVGHALLEHRKYYSDIELVQMELEAWEKADMLAGEFAVVIDQDHVEDCLDSYRDWLYKRSLCPACSLSGVQLTMHSYTCLFCHKQWAVSSDRFCRPYRRSL